ncbi:MAG: M23 family metallopeptidase [Chloroflexi bacterium]|nr:M23 family metallopeptidase [Chloroflexota bacterium]
MTKIAVWLSLALLMLVSGATAQTNSTDAILLVWNDELFAQQIADSRLVAASRPYRGVQGLPPTRHGNVYDYAASPLTEPPLDGYGFYQGVWSADGRVFAFLAVQPDDAGYHVILVEDGRQRLLFSGTVSGERGYLVPVGWADDSALILLERHLLHNLADVKLWAFSVAEGSLSLRATLDVPELSGNSASLAAGWVFVGFDTTVPGGYLVNINSGQVVRFPTAFTLPNPPPAVFEIYPVQVVGVVEVAEFEAWVGQPPAGEATAAPDDPALASLTTPFLYWPLPDDARSITCYPDSEWTAMQYALECPGLTTPRAYDGHEGTDIGGKPDGLPVSTPVYAAARGVVAARYTGCETDDLSCNDSYGNTVLLEHSRVIGYDVETWFTGYAHLQTVLVEPNAYVRAIGAPIALSGDTGVGGAHLHFEVRAPHLPGGTNWLDPWDLRLSVDGMGLWIGGTAHPQAAALAFPPPTLLVCQTLEGNNLRGGPGTDFAAVGKSTAQAAYEVFQVQRVEGGNAPGDWYHVRWAGSDATGWIWSDLMTECAQVE